MTESLFKRLESDPTANIDSEKLDYAGLHLHTAAFAESSNVVDWLLKQGINPNEPDEIGLTPLHASHARTERGFHVIKSLVKHGADIERSVGNGFTPLMLGRHRGDLGKVQCLISLGAMVPEESELTEVQGPLVNHANVQAIDDFLTSSDRHIPENIADICSR
jgi:ankyrin repeat protein